MRCLIFLPMLLAAAPARADQDTQYWTAYQVSGPVAGKLLIQADLAVRASDRSRGLSQIDAVVVLGTPISKRFALYGGYVRSLRYTPGVPTPVEERLRAQLSGDLGSLAGGAIALRLRGEMRWRNDAADTAWRGRAQVKWTRPFRTGGATALVLAHETYVNANRADWVSTKGIDRMRHSIGVSTPLGDRLRVEAGYLNQHRFVRRGPDLGEHVAQVALSWSL
jgi:hypothetical protein